MQTSIYPLEHYEFIRISGADNVSFLQGQLTCNTALLSPERSLNGALCNLKGRVIADFRLLKHDDDILMQCATGMASKIIATLSKYAVFSKVELTALESGPAVFGVMDDAIDEALCALNLHLPAQEDGVSSSAGCSVIRVAGLSKRIEVWMHTEDASEQFLAAIQAEPSADIAAWLCADIASGTLHITPPLSEEFTPQLLNYDLSGLVDFKKGCYTGQEIVARMFYRGTAKRRLQIASCSHRISSSSKVVAKTGEDLQEDILAFSNEGAAQPMLLAVLPLQFLDSSEPMMLSDNAESTVRVRELPYATN